MNFISAEYPGNPLPFEFKLPIHSNLEDFLSQRLAGAGFQDRKRKLFDPTHAVGAQIEIYGRQLLNFGSNNYLGLSRRPEVINAAADALIRYGAGSGASRLMGGDPEPLRLLEEAIRRYKGTEAALIYPSGYQANVGVLSALAGKGDAVFSDRLNHASLIDGMRLSGARIQVFEHGDMADLERLLNDVSVPGGRFVATDALFSMDGDLANLDAIVRLKERHGFFLIVDEAHALGVLGSGGGGMRERFPEASRKVDVWTGTLSKALGAQGGFAAGPAALKEWLVNASRPFIFSTGASPACAAAARRALEILQTETAPLMALRRNLKSLKKALPGAFAETADEESPILPVPVGEARAAIAVSERLFEEGVWAPAIRPPSVEEGKSRIRISITADHTPEHMERLARALKKALSATGAAA